MKPKINLIGNTHVNRRKNSKNNLIVLLGEFADDVVDAIIKEVPDGYTLIHDKTLDYIKDADYIIMGGGASLPCSLIEDANNLKFIQKWGIGVDKIDLKAAKNKNIPVAITAGSNADVVAEFAVLLMLALYRHLPFVSTKLSEGLWYRKEMRSVSYMIKGKLVGIIGLGHIGRKVAKKLTGFDANIQYYDINRISYEDEEKLNIRYCELNKLLKTSDIITLHLPLDENTQNFINAKRISLMKPSAILVNTARGAIIDENALAEALRNKKIWGAGLDVYSNEPPWESPLIQLENVIATPHIAGSTFDNVSNVARHCFRNIQLFNKGLSIPKKDLVEIRSE
jgi:D-3-phosphoglycerate dehydrogenase